MMLIDILTGPQPDRSAHPSLRRNQEDVIRAVSGRLLQQAARRKEPYDRVKPTDIRRQEQTQSNNNSFPGLGQLSRTSGMTSAESAHDFIIDPTPNKLANSRIL